MPPSSLDAAGWTSRNLRAPTRAAAFKIGRHRYPDAERSRRKSKGISACGASRSFGSIGKWLAVSLAAGCCTVDIWSDMYFKFAVWLYSFGFTYQRTFNLYTFDYVGTMHKHSQRYIQYHEPMWDILGTLILVLMLTPRRLFQARAPQVRECRSAAANAIMTVRAIEMRTIACMLPRSIIVLLPVYFIVSWVRRAGYGNGQGEEGSGTGDRGRDGNCLNTFPNYGETFLQSSQNLFFSGLVRTLWFQMEGLPLFDWVVPSWWSWWCYYCFTFLQNVVHLFWVMGTVAPIFSSMFALLLWLPPFIPNVGQRIWFQNKSAWFCVCAVPCWILRLLLQFKFLFQYFNSDGGGRGKGNYEPTKEKILSRRTSNPVSPEQKWGPTLVRWGRQGGTYRDQRPLRLAGGAKGGRCIIGKGAVSGNRAVAQSVAEGGEAVGRHLQRA